MCATHLGQLLFELGHSGVSFGCNRVGLNLLTKILNFLVLYRKNRFQFRYFSGHIEICSIEFFEVVRKQDLLA